MKKMMLMAAVCLMAAMTFAAQCVATTKKGTQCKREASPGSEFCWQHGGTTKAERATGETESSPPRKARRSESDDAESAPAPRRKASRSAPEETEAVPTPRRKTNRNESAEATSEPAADGQCQATTRSGTPCKRKAQAGGKYCAQHAAKMGKGGTEAPAARPKRRAKPKAETSETAPSAPSAETSDGQCQAKTKNGTPCRRKAQAKQQGQKDQDGFTHDPHLPDGFRTEAAGWSIPGYRAAACPGLPRPRQPYSQKPQDKPVRPRCGTDSQSESEGLPPLQQLKQGCLPAAFSHRFGLKKAEYP